MALILFLGFVIAIPWMAMHAPDLILIGIWTVLGIVILGMIVRLLAEREKQQSGGKCQCRRCRLGLNDPKP